MPKEHTFRYLRRSDGWIKKKPTPLKRPDTSNNDLCNFLLNNYMSKEAEAHEEIISDRDSTIERLQQTVTRLQREVSEQINNVRDANAIAGRERNRRLQMQATIDRLQARNVSQEERLSYMRRGRRLLRSYSTSMRSLVQRRANEETIIDLTFTESETEDEAEPSFGQILDQEATATTRFLSRFRGARITDNVQAPGNYLVDDHAQWQEAVTEREIQKGENAMLEHEEETRRIQNAQGYEREDLLDLLGSMFRNEDDQE